METDNKNEITENEMKTIFIESYSIFIITLIPIIIYSIFYLIRVGNHGDYLLLLLGSSTSILTIIVDSIIFFELIFKKKNIITTILSVFGNIIMICFVAYVTFIRGFWRLFKGVWLCFKYYISSSYYAFSDILIDMLIAILFIFLGYLLLTFGFKIPTIRQKINDGKLIIVKE